MKLAKIVKDIDGHSRLREDRAMPDEKLAEVMGYHKTGLSKLKHRGHNGRVVGYLTAMLMLAETGRLKEFESRVAKNGLPK